MSAKIMGLVYDLDLPSNEQAVLLAMADHADHEGCNIYPSNGLVAWKLGCSEDTVSRMKKKLEARGILVCVVNEPGRPKEYRIELQAGERKAPYGQRQSTSEKTYHPQTAAPRKATPPPQPQDSAAPPAAKLCPPPAAKLCGPNHQEPSREPSLKKKEALRFTDLFATRYLEMTGHRIANYPDAKTIRAIGEVIGRGFTPEKMVEIAVAAWKQAARGGRDAFWSQKASSIKGFIYSLDNIAAEVAQFKPQQAERNQSLADELNQ